MEDELKVFIQKKIDDANRYSKNIHDVYNYRAMAFGALMFAQETKIVNDEILTYWDNIWDEFQKLVLAIAERK